MYLFLISVLFGSGLFFVMLLFWKSNKKEIKIVFPISPEFTPVLTYLLFQVIFQQFVFIL